MKTEHLYAMYRFLLSLCVVGLTGLASASVVHAQTPEGLVGLGDSIGEGVQAADASVQTQSASYLNWIAVKMGVAFPLPLIQTSPFAAIGDTDQRFRLSPNVEGANLAVSGATTASLLRERADAQTIDSIDSETDLILFPRQGSQIEIAEALDPGLAICWIGNNDALRTATSWDQLDASQLTSEADFARDFEELAVRLDEMDSLVAFANIPNVADIAFLFDNADLTRFTGVDFELPDGHRTSVVVMLLLRLGLDDGSILQDPNFVLDPSEIAIIEERIAFFNSVIADRASDAGAPVLDVNTLYQFLADNPLDLFGVQLKRTFLGGLFSLDAVHPSNISHAIVADQMIKTLNDHYGLAIPRLTAADFFWTLLLDPHVDKDQDLRVRGRPLAGILETLGPALGFTGDTNDFETAPSVTTSFSRDVLRESITELKLGDETPWTRQRVLAALKDALTGRR